MNYKIKSPLYKGLIMLIKHIYCIFIFSQFIIYCEYNYEIYMPTVSSFIYFPSNYFYPSLITVSPHNDKNLLKKITSYCLKDYTNYCTAKLLKFLYPQYILNSRRDNLFHYQYGDSAFLPSMLALEIFSHTQNTILNDEKNKNILETRTIYATGSSDYAKKYKETEYNKIISFYLYNKYNEIKETEIPNLKEYSDTNFRIAPIGGLEKKIHSILKHIKNNNIENFLILLPRDNRTYCHQYLCPQIGKEIDYFKIQQSAILNNKEKLNKSMPENTIENNIVLKIFNKMSSDIANNYYNKLISKNKKSINELMMLNNILVDDSVISIVEGENIEKLGNIESLDSFYSAYSQNTINLEDFS